MQLNAGSHIDATGKESAALQDHLAAAILGAIVYSSLNGYSIQGNAIAYCTIGLYITIFHKNPLIPFCYHTKLKNNCQVNRFFKNNYKDYRKKSKNELPVSQQLNALFSNCLTKNRKNQESCSSANQSSYQLRPAKGCR